MTIYRDGSRSEQVLSIKEVNKEAKTENVEPWSIAPRERPEMTKGVTFRIRTGCGNLFVTINHDEKGICEVFATMGKSGGYAAAQSDGIARLISLALRAGVDTKAVIGQIRGLRCLVPTLGARMVPFFPAQMPSHRPLRESCPWETLDFGGSEPPKNGHSTSLSGNILGLNPQCPDCGAMLEFAEGCVICKSCGYSKCG